MAGFDDILGHEKLIGHLKSAIAMDKVSHAYILNGPEQSGKKMLAEAFAQTLQCERLPIGPRGGTPQGEDSSGAQGNAPQGADSSGAWEDAPQGDGIPLAEIRPCLSCHSCKQAMGRNHPDIVYVRHEKPNTISVDDIRRQVNNDIAIKPYNGRYKIYIIDEAQKMNVQAQNALLKTIEEPPAYAVLLLLTTNADSFLPTILSRCVRLDVKAVPDEKIEKFLMERYQIPDYQAKVCAAFAQGNVGKAIRFATSEDFNGLKDSVLKLLRRVKEAEPYELAEAAKQIGEHKLEINDYFDLMMVWYRDVLLYKATRDVDGLIFREEVYNIKRQAEQSSYNGIDMVLKALEKAKRRLDANVNFDLVIELLLLTIKEN